VTDLNDAINRANAYREAGADVIFVEAPKTEQEFADFAKAVPGPLLANMTEFGQTPLMDVKKLSTLGYQLVIYPVTLLRLALQSSRAALAAIKQQGSQQSLIPQMLTRQELYDLLGYTGYEARDRAYFGA
jgi:methylisocitrate lyase